MSANSYLEYVLTVLGWLVSNGIWSIITSTGLFALPLLMKLIAHVLKAREQGADEGDAGGLTLAWMENTVYMAMLVVMFTCVPLLSVDITQMQLNTERSKQCNITVPAAPESSGYAPLVNEINGQTARVPMWWYLVHVVSKGVMNAATVTLPCKPDLRQLRFDVQHTRIGDRILTQELQDFVMECYAPSLVSLKQRAAELTDDEDQDVAWPGSSRFMTQPGYYDTEHARTPRPAWPYNSDRDAGLVDNGKGGYPTCQQWWADADIGLKSRLLARVKPDVWQTFRTLGTAKETQEEVVLRALVSTRNMTVSPDGQAYSGYGGEVEGSFFHGVTRVIASTGNRLTAIAAFPAFDSLRQALPMVQAILQMALIICIPLVTVFSAYSVKTVLTLTFAQFGLIFLTFWWELARWLDSAMLSLLYESDTHSGWNLAGIQNVQDNMIMQFVLATMFLVLPAFWMGALGWAGLQVGGAIASSLRAGSEPAKQAGGEAAEQLKSVLTSILSKLR
ncbi:conjugal transfer protein TraG N-terminal domain-containing protein [Buttiauxella selenatireducens]|uniref:Conjugal transfer protein TraG N-terminal domain-containing protein n=1 Tax=Buttiauxella selenatireducens TaxID=3073902 RepID=A0ABY9S4Z0_9ENTR|nr:conjugal transfer protein TraG N-terminal domain-containing protein [Buttiauxella sp. R73]WMY72462.1 conjugal transfer protein TraG N-terminal domain-containing protein [Buttiauxella sp. R73]